jgi:segregation and condensation protein B
MRQLRVATEMNEEFTFDPQLFSEACRIAEALFFASKDPIGLDVIKQRMPDGIEADQVVAQLQRDYAHRGVTLVQVAEKFMFRTAEDLGYLLSREREEPRKLSKAALETLAIVAYHQPVTRAEIEDIRGVSTNKGTLDQLLETGWVRLRGRRKAPGRPVTYGTTDQFLVHFGLNAIGDLPGLDELKGAGFLDGRIPAGMHVPLPSDDPTLRSDEDPLEDDLLTSIVEEKVNAPVEALMAEDGGEVAAIVEETIDDEPMIDEMAGDEFGADPVNDSVEADADAHHRTEPSRGE